MLLKGKFNRIVVDGRQEPLDLLDYTVNAISLGILAESRRQVRYTKFDLNMWAFGCSSDLILC